MSMASKRCRNDASLPWILAIEALASNQTDASLLIDLVKKIPGEFSENDGKNARELVCLRVLESLSLLQKTDALPKSDSIAPSDCCEDVLRQVLSKSSRANQESNESQLSNMDVEQFVEGKRTCLPKCGLEQLKDVILKDNNLIPSALKEKSGLLNKNHSDGNATRPERSESDAFENPSVRNLSSGKTRMSDPATANQEGSSACKQLIVYKENPYINAAQKRKQDASFTHKAVEGKDSASYNERRHVENVHGGIVNERRHVDNVHGGIVQHSGREESDLPSEPRVENLRETIISEIVDCDRVASKKLKMSSTIGDAELLHNQIQGTCNVEKMTQGTSGEEHGLDIRCSEVKATMEHDHLPETLSDNENDEILMRNSTFLNSQYSHSQDSLATLNGTKQLCMVCKLGGHLLVCSSGSCQRVVHEGCMGVAPTFDATMNFYCPFCAYSLAILEYQESKKKFSLKRKSLMAFINRDEYRTRNSNILHRTDQNHLRESEISDKCVEQNRLENVVSRETKDSSRKNVRDKPSVSCDSSSRERARAVTSGGIEVALEDKRNAERGSSSVSCQSPSELEQQVPVLGFQNGEAESSLHRGSEQLGAVGKILEVSHQRKGVALAVNKQDQYVASQAVQDNKVQKNSKSKDLKSAHGRKQHARIEKEQDVSNQPPILPCEPAKPTHSNVVKSSGEENKSITFPSLRVRKQEQHYTHPSLPPRRKKIPWSNVEEETLKEGVKKFASHHDGKMPWKTILEFGADIFENRTAGDLKDKWRNICKTSPKVRKVRKNLMKI